jgi:hypothetical protein
VHGEMVQESVPSTQLPVPSKTAAPKSWVLATGYWVLICCSANVGSFTLDRKISAAGYARPGLRAAGDALCCPAGGHALHAPVDVPACSAAGDAMPSCHGGLRAAPARIVRDLVSTCQ